MRFIDGFGERRVFCRTCGRSILEESAMRLREQKRLFEFNIMHLSPELIGGRN
jgi:hypothetical protein